MDDDSAPSSVHIGAMAGVCSDTLTGWLWYCDVHNTHGNADFEEEAEAVAQAHRRFFSADKEAEPCDVVIWHRSEEDSDQPGPG
jgi:hypothetical protein